MESATLADILSTAIFIKGPQTGLDLAESIPEVDGAMVLPVSYTHLNGPLLDGQRRELHDAGLEAGE